MDTSDFRHDQDAAVQIPLLFDHAPPAVKRVVYDLLVLATNSPEDAARLVRIIDAYLSR